MELTVGKVFLYPFHVRVKSHRKHPVCLIKDEQLKMFQGKRPLEEVIEYATRRADDNVRAAAKGVYLLAIPDAAVHGDDPQACRAAQKFGCLRHLPAQLARGDEDERLAAIFRGIKQFQHRQDKGAGLAAAGAGLDHHISACKQVRDAPRLHGHEGCPPGTGGGVPQARGQLLQRYIRQEVVWVIHGASQRLIWW